MTARRSSTFFLLLLGAFALLLVSGAVDLRIDLGWRDNSAQAIDLFGSEISTNAANYFTLGLKGRYHEDQREDDHVLADSPYRIVTLDGEQIREAEVNALTAINECLRDDYVADCAKGLGRWNRTIAEAGIDFRLALPHRELDRKGAYISNFTVDAPFRRRGIGWELLASAEAWARNRGKEVLCLYVAGSNPARRLYERFGFQPKKTINSWLSQRVFGVRTWLYMVKPLTGHP